jgi:hypothetical protein
MAGFDRVGPANPSVPSDIVLFCGGACLGAFGEFEHAAGCISNCIKQ